MGNPARGLLNWGYQPVTIGGMIQQAWFTHINDTLKIEVSRIPPPEVAVEGSKIITTMILEPWKAIKLEPW
jgi:hypothetical protein